MDMSACVRACVYVCSKTKTHFDNRYNGHAIVRRAHTNDDDDAHIVHCHACVCVLVHTRTPNGLDGALY